VTCDATWLTSLCDVNACALISDQDEDFGDIHVIDWSSEASLEPLPSQLIEREALSHLSPEQQAQLLQVLDKYASCFSDILVLRLELNILSSCLLISNLNV